MKYFHPSSTLYNKQQKQWVPHNEQDYRSAWATYICMYIFVDLFLSDSLSML